MNSNIKSSVTRVKLYCKWLVV